jgi:hypothetical protein
LGGECGSEKQYQADQVKDLARRIGEHKRLARRIGLVG